MMRRKRIGPHQLEDTQVDKKAKTPKKPKSTKPKGSAKTA
jgi:hypothetical protein